jgi:eukaryotic-like serine/threonine-protein kinase
MLSQTLKRGTRIGKYEVLAHVAAGGMGSVYKARDLELQQTVALKLLPPELAARPITVERFRREARHAARLSHKNIVAFHEFGQSDGRWYLVMEFIVGLDLKAYIARKKQVDPEETRRFLKQAARALDHAHLMGIVHRDIKPGNFLLTREDGRTVVKLTDFGLAQAEDEEQFRLTRDGSTVGTIDYLSPEQARDSSTADVRSDIYSLGCTSYHMLAGNPPFAEGGLGERVYKHMHVEPADVRQLNARVPEPLWAILRKMLAKNPEDRFQTPAHLLGALDELNRGNSSLDLRAGLPLSHSLPPEGLSTTLLDSGAEPLPTAVGSVNGACQARDVGNKHSAVQF